MKILIKDGRVIDPSQKIDTVLDILIIDGKITEINKNINATSDKIISAKNKIVSSGFVDMHVHFREPGFTHKETIATGCNSAIHGGFTTVCVMPNTNPACDDVITTKYILEKAREINSVNVLPIGALTKNRHGAEMTNMMSMFEAGCVAFSDDGDGIGNSGLMRRIFEYAAMFNLLIISHCEDKDLMVGGVMHEGFNAARLGLPGIPAESESVMLSRDIQLAELTGARYHVAHVSTRKSVELIRDAKKRGVKITAEVAPHHFTLIDDDIKNYDTNFKVNPPLRSADDRAAIIEAIKDNTIDVIATDHAPHTKLEKEKSFVDAPFGMIGLETALPLSIMQLVDKNILNLNELINKLSTKPCEILNYNRGTLKIGAPADVTIFDINKKWIYKIDNIKSKSQNSPFIDWELKGAITNVIINGRIFL